MIYLDNAATTYPKPFNVRQAVRNGFKFYGANPGRSGYEMSIKTSQKIFECREIIKDMFNADIPENVIFTQNCTHSINMALKGLLKKGDHVVVSNFEHNAVMRPLYKLKEEEIINYDIAEVDINNDENTVKNFKKLINDKTTMIVCTHASNVFGYILPIEKIGKLAKEKNIDFVVDAAQAAGIVEIDMKKSNITALCMPGHKGLYGPTGTGILIWNNIDTEKINTIIEGGTGSLSANLSQPIFLPDRFESGTVNTMGIIGLYEGIKFVNLKGIDNLYKAENELNSDYWEALKEVKNILLYTGNPKEQRLSPVLSFNIKDKSSEEVSSMLNEYNVAVRGGYHCAIMAHKTMKTLGTGTVRLSLSVFSNKKEEKLFINIINKIAK